MVVVIVLQQYCCDFFAWKTTEKPWKISQDPVNVMLNFLRGVIFKIQPLKEPVNDLCTNYKSTPQGHVKSPTFWNFLDFIKNLTHQDFFFKIQNFIWEKIVTGVIDGLSINKNFDEKKIPKFQDFRVKNGSSVKRKKKSKHYLPIISWK